MNIGKELSKYNQFICLYCGEVDNEIAIRFHIWNEHQEKEINSIIKDLDVFLESVAIRFIGRYKILVEHDDLIQYLRTSIFLMLRDSYNPRRGTPEYFSKASCNIFLRRFLQEYNKKSNTVNISRSSDPSTKCIVDGVDMAFDNTGEYNAEGNWVLIDNRFDAPCGEMDASSISKELLRILTPSEKEIFYFVTDDSETFTQKRIAELLGISQPMVSYKLKNIRKKIKILLSDPNI